MKQIMGVARDVNVSHTIVSDRMDGLTVKLRVDTETGNQVEFILPPVLVKALMNQFLPQFLSANAMVYGIEAQEKIRQRTSF
ncbi:MAG: hypothetical protein U1E16_04000 [Hyphomicrobiales bacterium]